MLVDELGDAGKPHVVGRRQIGFVREGGADTELAQPQLFVGDDLTPLLVGQSRKIGLVKSEPALRADQSLAGPLKKMVVQAERQLPTT